MHTKGHGVPQTRCSACTPATADDQSGCRGQACALQPFYKAVASHRGVEALGVCLVSHKNSPAHTYTCKQAAHCCDKAGGVKVAVTGTELLQKAAQTYMCTETQTPITPTIKAQSTACVEGC
jgi:hypothetical protein